MWTVWMAAALAAGPAWAELEASDWEEVTTRKSDVGPVTVWRKQIGELNCLQGQAVTAHTPEQLMTVLRDVPSAKRWSSAGLAASEKLGGGTDVFDLYQYLDVPAWTLVSDRFWILRATVDAVPEGQRYRWEKLDAATAYPDVRTRALGISSGAIEPPATWGQWTFVRNAAGTVVNYRACADVGGSLPAGIRKWVATRTLPDTVADLVLEAQRRN